MATQEAPDFDNDFEEYEEPTITCWGKLQPLDQQYETLFMTDEAKKYVVGREGDLKIKKNIVSGKHCQIWKQSGVVFLEDTSTNGTFIKGERIPKRKPQIITSGTKITIVKANPKSNISEITFLYLDGEEEQKVFTNLFIFLFFFYFIFFSNLFCYFPRAVFLINTFLQRH